LEGREREHRDRCTCLPGLEADVHAGDPSHLTEIVMANHALRDFSLQGDRLPRREVPRVANGRYRSLHRNHAGWRTLRYPAVFPAWNSGKAADRLSRTGNMEDTRVIQPPTESLPPQSTASPALPWRLEEIDFSKLQPERVRDDDTLFFLLATSSFVEAASDLYTQNLTEYYAGDQEVADWLAGHWEHEEMQHGRALRAYIGAVWPQFDWERANAGFFEEYSAMCTLDEFEPTRGLEMAARCVVETGTSSLYRAIHSYTSEPLLKELTSHIKSDEVRHFSHFYQYFRKYDAAEAVSRLKVIRAIVKRIAEAKKEDSLVAYKHAFCVRFPDVSFEVRHYREYSRKLQDIMKLNFPFEMSIKMLLRPVNLPQRIRGPVSRLLVLGARTFIFG